MSTIGYAIYKSARHQGQCRLVEHIFATRAEAEAYMGLNVLPGAKPMVVRVMTVNSEKERAG